MNQEQRKWVPLVVELIEWLEKIGARRVPHAAEELIQMINELPARSAWDGLRYGDGGFKIFKDGILSGSEPARIGRFSIGADWFEGNAVTARRIFGECLIYSAEISDDMMQYNYIAEHPDFVEINTGDLIPKYQAVISLNHDDDGLAIEKIRWERRV